MRMSDWSSDVCSADLHANYRTDGPQEYRVVGETEFVEALAEGGMALGRAAKGICAGIVGHADLMLGAAAGPVLDAHIEASKRFRGIRFLTAIDPVLRSEESPVGTECVSRCRSR